MGQYYLRARYYDPSNGLFNRLDPFEGNNFDPQSLHKYSYAHGDPVNGLDPSGEFTVIEVLAVTAMLLSLAVLGTLWQVSAVPSCEITDIHFIMEKSKVPDFAKNVQFPATKGGVQTSIDDLGPYEDDNSVGDFQHVHWVVVEGKNLGDCKVERYFHATGKRGAGPIEHVGLGYQGNAFKIADVSDAHKDTVAKGGIQSTDPNSYFVVADAPGFPKLDPSDYPMRLDENFVVRIISISSGKLKAETWYRVNMKATAPGKGKVSADYVDKKIH